VQVSKGEPYFWLIKRILTGSVLPFLQLGELY